MNMALIMERLLATINANHEKAEADRNAYREDLKEMNFGQV
jgi:hypothetical protein